MSRYSERLVKALRERSQDIKDRDCGTSCLLNEAAERIENLQAEMDAVEKYRRSLR